MANADLRLRTAPNEPDAFTLPKGYGMRRLGVPEFRERGEGLESLFDLLLVWEPPRRKPKHRQYRYIMSADISDGIGQDRSVCDVLRFPSLDEPIEQVAQFITDSTSPEDFAPILDAIGRWYTDDDRFEALAAIEINNHGLATQALLRESYGYSHFYRWQRKDSANFAKRFTRAIGWQTTPTTRKYLLSRGRNALMQVDPVTGQPGIIIHSPHTLEDLANFTSPSGFLSDAEASSGNHDDCVFSLFIGNVAIDELLIGEAEPLADRRARHHREERARDESADGSHDWRNSEASAADALLGLRETDRGMVTDDEAEELAEGLLFDY